MQDSNRTLLSNFGLKSKNYRNIWKSGFSVKVKFASFYSPAMISEWIVPSMSVI
jgi:hypothetical protein